MRPVIPMLLFLVAGGGPAAAHGSSTPSLAWTFDPWILAPMALVGGLHMVGRAKLWKKGAAGRKVRWQRAVLFWAGWLSLGAALVSPLHELGERLFSAHMVEHEIVMAIAAPLLVLARPAGCMMWALPRGLRLKVAGILKSRSVQSVWQWLTRPQVATVMHGVVIWIWHAPSLFDAAVADVALHRMQHVSFFVTAILFWWAIFRAQHLGVAAWDVFVTMLHTSVLGALISLTPRILYHVQTADAETWGFRPIEDQQLAGIIMWVPAGTIYAGVVIVLVARWIRASGLNAEQGHASARPC